MQKWGVGLNLNLCPLPKIVRFSGVSKSTFGEKTPVGSTQYVDDRSMYVDQGRIPGVGQGFVIPLRKP